MTYDLVKRTMLVLLGLWIVMVLVGYASTETPANVGSTWIGSMVPSGSEITLRRVQ